MAGRSSFTGPTTADLKAHTLAEITVLEAKLDPATRRACLKVKLANKGQTAWLHKLGRPGYVGLALYQGRVGNLARPT